MSILDDDYIKPDLQDDSMPVSSSMKQNWNVIGKWAMFLSVIGFIALGLFGLIIMAVGPLLGERFSNTNDGNPGLMAAGILLKLGMFFFLAIFAVMFMVYFYHVRFAARIQRAVLFKDQDLLESAWLNLRNHFRIYGVVAVVCMFFYLMLVLTIVLGKGLMH